MTIRPLYQLLAMFGGKPDALTALQKWLPSGSGFDNGTQIESITTSKIVLLTSYHDMDDSGYYCGWYDYTVRVSSDLLGPIVKVTGSNKRGLRDYVAETMVGCLMQEYEILFTDGEYTVIPA